MTDSTENKPTERKKLSLQGPPPAEVKQSFSNRRSKTVQVEHKVSRANKANPSGKTGLSQGEMERRAEALRNAQNRPTQTADTPNLPLKVIRPPEVVKPVAEKIDKPVDTPAIVPPAEDAVLDKTSKEAIARKKFANSRNNDAVFEEAEKQKKTLRLKGDDRRRQGKLTVVAALSQNDDEDSAQQRGRSLAALKRARDKERQHNLQKLKSNEKVIRDVIIPESISVAELANRMAERVGDVVKALMAIDVLVTPSQLIDADTAELVVGEFGHKIRRVAESDVEEHLIAEEETENTATRPPVVSIMGHVDHGKTTLLDTLRSANVAGGEAGGITQHVGAYQVELKDGKKITFLDTPGHQAFTAMRARGANITDIAILVIAADDGVREQTVESINHAKAAKLPMIIAITKSDKQNVDIAKIYNELLNHEIVVEALGGEVLNVEISAEKGLNLDKLQEAILLQAELCDLGCNPDRAPYGFVIESFLDKGRGNIASLLVQNGTLRQGDIFVAGGQWGRVRALMDEKGKSHKSIPPSAAIEVLGLQGLPMAGDRFDVVENEAKAREIAEYRQRQYQKNNSTVVARGIDNMFSQIQAGLITEIPVIVKADMHGSLEALKSMIDKTNHESVKIKILHAGVGAISESDISLADTTEAFIIGFNVRANSQARKNSDKLNIDIRYYSVIYHMAEDLEKIIKGKLAPEIKEEFLGYADVKEVFAVSKVGKVAGCLVTEGAVKRAAKVRLLRDDVVIYEGVLKQLKRFKDDAAEVTSGMECGIALENYNDMKSGDKIECFNVIIVEQK